MRRLLAALALILVLLGGTTIAQPAAAASDRPDTPEVEQRFDRPADTVSYSTILAQCRWGQAAFGLQSYYAHIRMIHYGTAHVTQCWYHNTQYISVGMYSYCYQYVWGPGVANPRWELYKAGFYPTVKCWT
jgi:hypothetical protein